MARDRLYPASTWEGYSRDPLALLLQLLAERTDRERAGTVVHRNTTQHDLR